MKHLLICTLLLLSSCYSIAQQEQVLRQKTVQAEKYRTYPEVVLLDSTAVTVPVLFPFIKPSWSKMLQGHYQTGSSAMTMIH